MGKPDSLLVVGSDVRHVAYLAWKAGFKVYAVDYWGDLDLRWYVKDWISILEQKPGKPLSHPPREKIPELLVELTFKMANKHKGCVKHVVLSGGLDDKPDLWALLSDELEVLGNKPETVIKVRDLTLLHELAGKAGFKTESDIGKERIRRVIQKIEAERTPSESELPGMENEKPELDLGFKVFKLDRSNFKLWDGEVGEEPTQAELEKQLELGVDHIHPDSTPEDILYELLLKSGFPLTTPIQTLELAGKTVYSIEDDALLICLEDDLTKEVITEMAKRQPARVVCLDQGFAGNDQLKTNAVQIMKSHEVDDFRTV